MGQYVGLDLSLKETPISVMNGDGTVLHRAIAATDAEAVEQILTEHSRTPHRIVRESASPIARFGQSMSSKMITFTPP